MANHMTTVVRTIAAVAVLATAAGCSDDTDVLRAQIAEIKVKPYETFAYPASDERSPFEPGMPASATGPNAIRPDSSRPREFLEQFSLDTLRMVGTLKLQGRIYGLVQTKDGLVHRVLPGNHLGQSDGRITAIEEGKISLIEIVPDGMGGFIQRPAALGLSD